jgi:hypothetical protein
MKIQCYYCGTIKEFNGKSRGTTCSKCKRWISVKKGKIQMVDDTFDVLGKVGLNPLDELTRDKIINLLGFDLSFRFFKASKKRKRKPVKLLKKIIDNWLKKEGF